MQSKIATSSKTNYITYPPEKGQGCGPRQLAAIVHCLADVQAAEALAAIRPPCAVLAPDGQRQT